ncbi:TLDc domain-containing protein [Entamoeba marina]
MVEYLNNAINKDDLNSISSIEMKNLNEIKDYGNKLVDKILEKETILFNKQQEELKQLQQQKILEFEEKKNELKGLIFNKYEIEKQKESDNDNDMLNSKEQQQLLNDIEFNVIENSMSKLKEWCGKQKHNIIFDSLIDGDGSDNVLMNKVTNKSHLYFISFDTNNNVFGGYFRKSINVVDSYIEDRKSFVFSLLRNGVMKNLKYLMHNDRSWSFRLYSGSNWLYRFGDGDIGAYKIGEASSYCSQNTYEYYNETKPFVDCGTNPFIIKRIVIMKMS